MAAGFLGLGLRQAWTDAPTYDEPIYLSAGVTSLLGHDLRLNPEHPPLAKALAALPSSPPARWSRRVRRGGRPTSMPTR